MASLLVVEDEEAVRRIYVERLSDEGYEVFAATDGLDGILKAREHHPDVIISDITMPKMDGIKFYTELQNDKPELAAIPFIFLTGKSGTDDKITGMRLGVDGYLTKPVRYDLLSATIKSRIGYHKRLMNLLESNRKQNLSSFVPEGKLSTIRRLSETSLVSHPRSNQTNDTPLLDLQVAEAATNSINQGFVIWDPKLRLVAWSSKCSDFWYDPPNFLKPGMPMIQLLRYIALVGGFGPGEPNELAQTQLLRFSEGPMESEEEFQMLDNRVISIQRHLMENGGHASTYTDITERKQAEEARDEALREAKRANDVKTEFLAHVSHELRTPLNAIIGFSQIWMDEVFGPLQNSKYKEYAKDINNSGTHLLEIIADILDLSKIVSGEMQLNLEDVNITAVLDYCVTSLGQRSEFNGISFTYHISPDFCLLHADRRMLEQILLNLSENALASTPHDGEVNIDVNTLPNGSTRFVISDTGFGIPAGAINTALEPFGQVRESATVAHSGIGLGLPLAKQKTELHGGSFTINSVEGEGTSVIIDFPPEMSVRQH